MLKIQKKQSSQRRKFNIRETFTPSNSLASKNVLPWQTAVGFGFLFLVGLVLLNMLYRGPEANYGKQCSEEENVHMFLSHVSLLSVLLFSLMCVTSMIIAQLIAARFKLPPFLLFFLLDKRLRHILSLVSVSFLLSTITQMLVSEGFSCFSVYVTLVLITCSILLSFAYFSRFFLFLKPWNVLTRIKGEIVSNIEAIQSRQIRTSVVERTAKVSPEESSSPSPQESKKRIDKIQIQVYRLVLVASIVILPRMLPVNCVPNSRV